VSWVIGPGLADKFLEGVQPLRLEPAGEVVVCDEVGQMLACRRLNIPEVD
jgi:hypothetical protein